VIDLPHSAGNRPTTIMLPVHWLAAEDLCKQTREDATQPGKLAGLSDRSSCSRPLNVLFLVQYKPANLASHQCLSSPVSQSVTCVGHSTNIYHYSFQISLMSAALQFGG